MLATERCCSAARDTLSASCPETYIGRKFPVKADLRPTALHRVQFSPKISGMAEESGKGPFFKEWRKLRGFTQEQVLAALDQIEGDMPRTGASLSRLENGKQPYSQEILEALAVVYNATPGKLLDLNPAIGASVSSFFEEDSFRALPEQAQTAIRAVLGLAGEKGVEADPSIASAGGGKRRGKNGKG